MPKTFQDAVPNLSGSAAVISVATVAFTYPQVAAVSQGKIPRPTVANTFKVLGRALPFQIPVKFGQFAAMRTLKLKLDEVSPATTGLNTMVSYGSTGVPFQSCLYNQCISDIYKFHGASPPQASGANLLQRASRMFWTKVYPGIVWCFIRESCATGGALVLGPQLRPKFEETFPDTNPAVLKFASGLCAGSMTAFLTQWMHNTALTAGTMAELGERATTAASIKRAATELGTSIFYKNYGRRMVLIATASATLNTMPIF